MTEPSLPVKIELTKEFKRNLRLLSRKYRHIKRDIQPVIEQLQTSEVIGDQIPGTGYTVFKVRVKNSDIQRGKSAGYRLIYYLQTPTYTILVYIYSKLDQADISVKEIREILAGFKADQS